MIDWDHKLWLKSFNCLSCPKKRILFSTLNIHFDKPYVCDIVL